MKRNHFRRKIRETEALLNNAKKTGMLYLVSTPIGNLEDITPRALRTLEEVNLIAAEDTRRTGLLLKHFNITSSLESYHDFNKEKKTPRLLELLNSGQTIAVVSDAGTPGISDPAFYLVKRAIEADIPVVPIPGASAAIASVTVSGLPTDRFVFEGFLPPKKGRNKRLEQLSRERRTIVLYEAPHRLIRTLNDLKAMLGDRRVALCRELTKRYEQVLRGSISEMIETATRQKIRGEIVLVIEGNQKK
jgi:16S rRNA (cytidine1402-2'-O)-methyltransferase